MTVSTTVPDTSEGVQPRAGETPLGLPSGIGPSGRAGALPVQRVRVTFAKDAPIRFISHLDVVRLWERALRRARLPLAYTLGYTPHPRLVFAAPLALGATGAREIMDLYLTRRVDLDHLAAAIRSQLPPACRLIHLHEVPLDAPSAMALVRWAEYRIEAVPATPEPETMEASDQAPGSRWARGETGETAEPSDAELAALAAAGQPWRPPAERLPPLPPPSPLPPAEELQARIDALLAAGAIPHTRQREGKTLTNDLRPLIIDLWLAPPATGAPEAAHDRPAHPPPPTAAGPAAPGEWPLLSPPSVTLGLLLRLDPSHAGARPEEVVAALGLRARHVHRLRIGLEGEAPGRAADGS
jgi:hypothetical protein